MPQAKSQNDETKQNLSVTWVHPDLSSRVLELSNSGIVQVWNALSNCIVVHLSISS
eukprot:jgi/Bigna1/59435/fgenesh1_kg.4_\